DDLQRITAVNRNRQLRQDAVAERIGELKAQADAAVVAADKARTDAADRTAEIQQIQADQTELAAQLEAARDQLDASLESARADDAALESRIAEIVAEEKRKEAERLAAERAARE